MTIGQRIAERRKMLGLSQEALGEKMGVSRQAISKWESDGAVPEIDKLIALSRLFSVSIGWLLGLEEEAASAAESAEQPGLSDEQLKMVEEIIKRYQQPQPKHRGFLALAAMGLCCAVAALVISLASWNNASRQFPNYDAQLQNLSYDNSYIQGQLSDLTGRLDELAEGEKLLSEFETRTVMPADDATVLNVTFTGVPKTWQAGSEAYLSLRQNGLEALRVPCTWDGVSFTAETQLKDFSRGYESYFVLLREDGSQEQQNVTDDTLESLPYGAQARIEVDGMGWTLAGNVLTLDHLTVRAILPELMLKGENEAAWKSFQLVLQGNGENEQAVDLIAVGENVFELYHGEPEYGADGSVAEPVPVLPEMPEGALWLSANRLEFRLPEKEPGQQVVISFVGDFANKIVEYSYFTLQMGQDGFYEVVEMGD